MKTTLKELNSKIDQVKKITGIKTLRLDHSYNGYKVYLFNNKHSGIIDENFITSQRLNKTALWFALDTFLKGYLLKDNLKYYDL